MSGRKRYEGTPYVGLSPREKEVRIKRAARALQEGVQVRALEMRGFTRLEIEQARKMVEKK